MAGDEEAEERRALERELADELAALSAQDVGFGANFDRADYQSGDLSSNGQDEESYVRLDLDKVLQQVTELPVVSSDEDESEATSWELLLQSVERSDREFYQPFHEDLHEIRASFLDGNPSAEHQEQKNVCKIEPEGRVRLDVAVSQSEQIDSPPLAEIVKIAVATREDEIPSCKTEADRTATVGPLESVSDTPLERSTEVAPTGPRSHGFDDATAHTPPLSDDHPTTSISKQLLEDDQAVRKQLQEIARQQEVRESRRLKAQARHQRERDEAERLLRSLQDAFEAQERKAEIAEQEAQERSLMTSEEQQGRLYVAAEREAREVALMTLADEASRKVAAEFARIRDAIDKEVAQMAAADQAERHRMQAERQIRDQQLASLARCRFSAALTELVERHGRQQQIRDQETRRGRRECVQMRAEEAYTRRVVAETRALREQQERGRNRVLMLHEDEVAGAFERLERDRNLRAQERVREENDRAWMEKEEARTRSAWACIEHLHRQNEQRSRVTMGQEEERCRCAWEYLAQRAQAEAEKREKQRELRRLRVAADVAAGLQGLERVLRQHSLVKCVDRWRRWHERCVEEELARAKTADHAAKRIQMWHRSHRQQSQQLVSVEPPLLLEDFSDDEEPQVDEDSCAEAYANCSASQEAALRLQSTFRGFHVRRKFANALALAEAVGEHEEGDFFDAVDLDDLIQLPPELVDGWEDPVLPAASIARQRKSPPQHEEIVGNNAMEEYVEAVATLRNLQTCTLAVKPVPRAPASGNPPKEHNLAATLWNKMKRAKNRQQHVQQERQRQQDPAYRVQKLLNRKPTHSNQSGNQSTHSSLQGGQKAPTVSWSSTSSAKKKPKVKIPSLVERLRRQTMAER
ncbi:hypothetical protein KRP22_002857 [Phytophthora ramorum]|uniref:uncharacterized protein n=1 Tax=Phytophthora ramorum TaxID=164328 RepID=UPI0030AFCCF2|nr:hypothetical protein KRP23_592 [Phytophthora ramorum]KAH7503453.1 hypothetical protein KRP22_6505 [Phytophthora ramorum]